jgi:hypothetical protein
MLRENAWSKGIDGPMSADYHRPSFISIRLLLTPGDLELSPTEVAVADVARHSMVGIAGKTR